jgi:COP9 signalosome complex subunit 6
MLHSRISLLRSYLTSLPASYLTTGDVATPAATPPAGAPVHISHPLLRSILALTARLPLLIPADEAAFAAESAAEKSDVALVELLGGIGKSLKEVKDLGSRFSVVESARRSKEERRGLASHAWVSPQDFERNTFASQPEGGDYGDFAL